MRFGNGCHALPKTMLRYAEKLNDGHRPLSKGMYMTRFIKAALACACALALSGILVACSAGTSALSSEQQENRSYMSQVNGVMATLGDDLDSFVGAVSRNDVVNMRTQADNAYKALDELAAIEAPEALADVQQDYVDGTEKMRKALDAYIELYTDLEAGSFDQSTYSSRIAEVQSLYDEAVEQLKKADEAAAEK